MAFFVDCPGASTIRKAAQHSDGESSDDGGVSINFARSFLPGARTHRPAAAVDDGNSSSDVESPATGCSAYFSSIGSTKQSVKHARKRPFFKVAVLGGTKARSDSDRRSPRKFPSSYVPQESKAATLSAPAEEVQAEEPVRSRRGESMLAEIDPAGPGHAETSAGCASLDASVEETRVKAQHLRKHFPQARQQVVEARLLWSAKLGRLAEAVARHEKEIEAAVGNLSDILAAVRDLSRASADSE